jgi:LPS-assembly protein
MLKSRFSSGLATMLLVYGFLAHAEDERITAGDAPSEPTDALVIEGDKFELHLDRKMRAIGKATISRGNQKVFGDVIDYDVQNDDLHVMGNARITLGNAQLIGPELHMQMSTSIGEMKNASISMIETTVPNITQRITQPATPGSEDFSKGLGPLQSQQVNNENNQTTPAVIPTGNKTPDYLNIHPDLNSQLRSSKGRGDAKTILFEGQDKKRLKEARYTTCAAGVDDWYIKASELELNDYTETSTAKNVYIEFKDVPIIYSPWMSFSLNNQRKSGLLTPTYASSDKNGFELAVPYYWNISPNMDATITTRAMSKTGVQLQGEFRYLEESFSGTDNLEYLPSDNQTGEDRYYANLKHQHTLGKGWSAGYSLEKVSDDQYFSDLSTNIVTTSRINLPQQVNLNYADDRWKFDAIAQKFQTLDNLSYPYERLPQMTLSGTQYFGNVDTNIYTQFVAFDTNTDAPTQVTGSRFTAFPNVSYPINQSYGFIIPKVGVHHTSYNLNDDPNNQSTYNRSLPITSLDSGLFFDRDFKVSDRAYLQTLEPRLFYVYVPYKNQSDLPVFDTTQSDFNFSSLFSTNQFTGNDRINNANQVSLSLTTRLIERDSGTQRLSAAIGQQYYFTDQKVALPGAKLRTRDSSDIIAALSTNLKTTWNLDALLQYNPDRSRFARTSFLSRYTPEPGKTLNLSYSYYRDSESDSADASINQFDISSQWALGKGWYGIGRVNYSLLDKQNNNGEPNDGSRLIEAIAGIEYDAGCWQTRTVIQRLTTATAGSTDAIFFQLELGGLASIGANPLTVINRSIPGYVKTGDIPKPYK